MKKLRFKIIENYYSPTSSEKPKTLTSSICIWAGSSKSELLNRIAVKILVIFSSQIKVLVLFSRWKIHESVLLAMGSVKTLLLDSVSNGKLQFDVPKFLQVVVLNDMSIQGRFEVCHLFFSILKMKEAWSSGRVPRFVHSNPIAGTFATLSKLLYSDGFILQMRQRDSVV